MSSVEHDRSQLGAYAIGALEPAEERAVHAHVVTCPDCQRELAEFVDLRQALDQVPPEAFLDGPPDDGELLLRRTLRRLRTGPPRVPRRVAVAAVLVVVALGAGFLAGRGTAPDPVAAPPAETVPAGTVTARATNADTGASMDVTVEPRAGWVWVTATVRGVAAGERCALLVVPRLGAPLTAGSWLVSDRGEADGLRLEGTALVDLTEVRAIEVVTTDGRTMVSVPL